jgi:hypothetical protein
VRERGTQSRRVRAGPDEADRGAGPGRAGSNFWQGLAIVALIAATAGWTTVAVLVLREPSPAAVTPSESIDPNATDDSSIPPDVATHDVPDLEAVLPTSLNGTTLETQSSTGDGILSDDAWSTSMTSFLTSVGKTGTDLQFAQAYDPSQVLDGGVGVYRVAGVEGTAIRDALVKAWKGDYPDMVVSEVTLDGKSVTKGDFGADTIDSFVYVRDGLAFDIETTDEKIATAALAALPVPGASASPRASGSPARSAAPAVSASPAAPAP